ncbi:MAG: hypothetical protein AAF662_09550 [Pseudomonadota bacterium]
MGRPKKQGDFERVSLDIEKDLKRRIEEIRDDTRAGSLAAVMATAFAVYEYVHEMESKGGQFVLRLPDEPERPQRMSLAPLK